ncbi:hypothetical protein T484DRAFT_2562005 [Baffinella frigidus]|nr:hypothetical protein T484DRAFT_2562005 [Cryptophyta sp. CCMP2293]
MEAVESILTANPLAAFVSALVGVSNQPTEPPTPEVKRSGSDVKRALPPTPVQVRRGDALGASVASAAGAQAAASARAASRLPPRGRQPPQKTSPRTSYLSPQRSAADVPRRGGSQADSRGGGSQAGGGGGDADALPWAHAPPGMPSPRGSFRSTQAKGTVATPGHKPEFQTQRFALKVFRGTKKTL